MDGAFVSHGDQQRTVFRHPVTDERRDLTDELDFTIARAGSMGMPRAGGASRPRRIFLPPITLRLIMGVPPNPAITSPLQAPGTSAQRIW